MTRPQLRELGAAPATISRWTRSSRSRRGIEVHRVRKLNPRDRRTLHGIAVLRVMWQDLTHRRAAVISPHRTALTAARVR